jgi:hypothetical protein
MLMLNRTRQFASYCANQRDSGAPLRSSGTAVEIDPSWRAEGARQVLGRHGLAAHYILAHASSARANKLSGHAACVEPDSLHLVMERANMHDDAINVAAWFSQTSIGALCREGAAWLQK